MQQKGFAPLVQASYQGETAAPARCRLDTHRPRTPPALREHVRMGCGGVGPQVVRQGRQLNCLGLDEGGTTSKKYLGGTPSIVATHDSVPPRPPLQKAVMGTTSSMARTGNPTR
jgi:hypothetical protein